MSTITAVTPVDDYDLWLLSLDATSLRYELAGWRANLRRLPRQHCIPPELKAAFQRTYEGVIGFIETLLSEQDAA